MFLKAFNIFRLAGDMTHLLSIIVLLLKINGTKSCAGISLKTQELYALVFVTRYLDLITGPHIYWYNTVMKIIFLASTFSIIYLIRAHKVIRHTYDREQDTFRYQFLVIPCAVLAVFTGVRTPVETLWRFSIILESVAILPQLIVLQRTQNIDIVTGHYVFLLGSYRALYILNWIYRYMTEPGYRQYLVWICGLIQTILYCDFFWYYIKSMQNMQKLMLPA